MVKKQRDWNVCEVDGCEKDAMTRGARMCHMHYSRVQRNGHPGEAAPRQRAARSPHCIIGGCRKPDKSAGLCSMHAARKARHGDPHKVIKGELFSHWTGDAVTYRAAHTRVEKARGKASQHPCLDCGQQARHWSYNYEDPNEKYTTSPTGMIRPFSADIDYYEPRCIRCHQEYDSGR